MRVALACAAVTVTAVAGCAQGAEEVAGAGRTAQPQVRLDSGVIGGVDDGDVVRFRGVPYAAPPVGRLRWRSPEPPAAWRGVRAATVSGPVCPQPGTDPARVSGQEDCLTLDVTMPKKAATTPRPVMVWLHGGGFTAGTGSETDPRRLAVEGDMVVVTVEFRLGVLGYMALPGMTDAGSFGLQDQQAALRWVRRNAGAFGADPRNVTLFGESGGGVAVCGHLTSPAGRGLFSKAIMQSGACGTVLLANSAGPGSPRLPFWRPMRDSVAATRAGAKQLGCPVDQGDAKTLDCLRAQPLARLLTLTGRFAAAAYGGRTLPRRPARALEEGRFSKVPVLSGHTADEALMFADVFALAGKPITDADLPGLLAQGFGDKADEIAGRYPREDHPSAAQAWAAAYTDAVFACPHAEADDALARRTPVYAYVFADRTAPPYLPTPPGFPAGAPHASELAYLFEVKDKPIDLDGEHVPLTPAQRAVADDMVAAWTTFARTGAPGGKGWPRWERGRRLAHVITEKAGSTAVTGPPRCGGER
ncbi:carboxylesterase/lipase family protein [Streptosporangium carneum]|nr:carboxylesterase family protein [Streptosporangium carneum]